MRQSKSQNKRSQHHGLTLLEVLVAIAIFAIVGTAILKAVGDNLYSVEQVESITIASWVANNQLARIELEKKWPIRNNARGSVNMAGRDWYWRQQVLDTNDSELKQVTVYVGRDAGYENSITSVTAYFAKPTVEAQD
ncbi:type II secretion system protein GspI [Alteromonas sediminis]|uniref:Type II secretion system protein I n=2 Tax=Alteromonas sediminis TaxID=2259342 RepID=A0A3N5Z7U7_9ALTE|nr:type II secretion system protein GspI [Alteromonas sediminis]